MQCPVDGETLVMTSREGVEIDYCPKCRGVWLDRGELDKIIERSEKEATQYAAPRSNGYDKSSYKKKKPKSLISELMGDLF